MPSQHTSPVSTDVVIDRTPRDLTASAKVILWTIAHYGYSRHRGRKHEWLSYIGEKANISIATMYVQGKELRARGLLTDDYRLTERML